MMVEINKNGIKIDGREELLLCASFFYFRIPRKEWASRAKLLSSLGYNCVDIYFPWNFHEVEPGVMDFTNERNADYFLRICAENHLYVIARPGPYICSEWDGGGLPSWVIGDCEIRQNDERYLSEVKKWFDNILPVIARHQIGGEEQGSVILLQLENELDFFDCLDVEGYMESLKHMALSNGITVPLFACAGQGDIRRSGGMTDGVLPTYNFYPSLSDATFDYTISQYSQYISRQGLPFLISETDRKHCILKREMMSGAKLLGAYNQVGGTNFAYYQSINNWGNPLSLICTLYDFDGMIDNLGHCTKEADEALLLSRLLSVYGRKLAAGMHEEMDAPFELSDRDVAFTNAVTLAEDGGKLICVRSVRENAAVVHSMFRGLPFELSVESYEALVLPYGLRLDGYEILFSNNEIFSLEPLILIERSKPFLLIEQDGKLLQITGPGKYGTIEVAFLSREEAIARIKAERRLEIPYSREQEPVKVTECRSGGFHNPKVFVKAESSLFSDNHIWFGEVEYRIKSNGKRLFLKGVGDFLTVTNDGEAVFAGLCAGDDVIVDGRGEVRATVEKWGHSNFDDARKNTLRIKAKRGIEKIYQIQSGRELTKWRFTETDCFSEDVKIEKSETDPYLSINSWNSTREPLYAAYYTEISPAAGAGEELLLFLEGPEAECNLFINGSFIFRFSEASKSVNITEYVKRGEKNLVELNVRKTDWARRTGNMFLLKAAPCEFEIRQIDHTDACGMELAPSRLPLPLQKGRLYAASVKKPVLCDTYGYIRGKGFRATVIQDGSVIARIVADTDRIIQVGSPDNSKFLIPGGKDDTLYFFIEAMSDGSFEFAVGENTYENNKN